MSRDKSRPEHFRRLFRYADAARPPSRTTGLRPRRARPTAGLASRDPGEFRDDYAIADDVGQHSYEVPRIPASVGALIFDPAGRLLVLKPNYKKGWTIPGGQMDTTGESPWEACVRETMEECGLEPAGGRLVCVDFRRPKPSRPGGMRFLFDCGTMTDAQLSTIRLQAEEIDDYRLVELDEALTLLSGPIRRRVAAGVGAERCVYLEDGRAVAAVRA